MLTAPCIFETPVYVWAGIELWLAGGRRLAAHGKDRGDDWWRLVSKLLVLDGKTELASELEPYAKSHSIGEWLVV